MKGPTHGTITIDEAEEVAKKLTTLELSKMICGWFSPDWQEWKYELNDIHKIAVKYVDLNKEERPSRGFDL